jgi:hypothetical protein
MVRRSRNPLACWTILALYVLSSGVMGHGVVVCEQPDGRTVIEIVADHERCLGHLDVVHDEPAGTPAEPEPCGELCCADCPCEDTPLSPELAPVEKKSPTIAALPLPAVQPWLAGPGATSPQTEPVHAVDRVTRRSLRSIVLLV